MKWISATTRVTLGLLCMAVSVWLLAFFFGLIPDESRARLNGRIKLCENVALHCSLLASRNDLPTMETALTQLMARDSDILSVGLRDSEGTMILEAGDHAKHWNLAATDRSLPSQIRIPILSGDESWGTIELRFRDVPLEQSWFKRHPLLTLGLFATASTYLLFFVYLRNMMRHLDPTQVIPKRVRQTLDNMAGGLLVLDAHQRILLANQAFAEIVGVDVESLTGKLANELPFEMDGPTRTIEGYPWERALKEGEPQVGDILVLRGELPPPRILKISAAPVYSDNGVLRGTMVGFDDVTRLREQQDELKDMLKNLSESRAKIQQQNQELERLANRDALTGCLNRRAFFREFEKQWLKSERVGSPLACIMVDLDHFKKINDTHGHQMGDLVLQRTAEVLRQSRFSHYIICRYGGEEFSVLLPDTELDGAVEVAESIRTSIQATDYKGIAVTSSLGVSVRSLGARDPNELLDQADKCLYVAKRNGRNCVVRYDQAAIQIAEFEAGNVAKPAPQPVAPDVDASPSIPFNAVMALVSALAYRDQMTADHSRRVADLCVMVARRLMPQSEAYTLEIAALLHDIGKIGVPDAILLKPGKLTKDEWKVMYSQERIGVEIIKSSFSSPALHEIIRTYRAWYGGNARHPELPVGTEIPLSARILAIADAYDSITSRNPYREPMSPQQAFAELKSWSGQQFDPILVDRFIEFLTEREGIREQSDVTISQTAALSLGNQIEGLATALDHMDLSGIATLAHRLSLTASRFESNKIAEAAAQLEAATRNESDMKGLVRLTNELVDLCRSAQRAYLDKSMETVSAAVKPELVD
ncbi:MAG: diguanylate cyclase [Pirellulales bacterium]